MRECSLTRSPSIFLLATEEGVLLSPAVTGDLSISLAVYQFLFHVFEVLLLFNILLSF